MVDNFEGVQEGHARESCTSLALWAMARALVALLIACALISSLAAAECIVDGNVKTPLTGLLAHKQDDYTSQLGGWTVRVPWSSVETQPGVYNFDVIDKQLEYASNVDGYRIQGVNLEITTGFDAPQWLKTVTLTNSAPFWNRTYQDAYRNLMRQLAKRYNNMEILRGVHLSACVDPHPSLSPAGKTELSVVQCFYDAMFAHVSAWSNTPTILPIDARSLHAAQDFRRLFGPRLGVLLVTQSLAQPIDNAIVKAMQKIPQGALTVSLVDALSDSSTRTISQYLNAAVSMRATTVVLPSGWSVAQQSNFVSQLLIDDLREKLTALPLSCDLAPGRSVTAASVSSMPSYVFTLVLQFSPDEQMSKQRVLQAVARLTGLPESRFSIAPLSAIGKGLVAAGYIYDVPYGASSRLIAKYIEEASEGMWRRAGLAAKTLSVGSYSSGGNGSSLDALTIFLIVLAAVIYFAVFLLVCYLMVFVVRYCIRNRDRENATMATITDVGKRMRGWVSFKDEEVGFPSTATAATTAPSAAV